MATMAHRSGHGMALRIAMRGALMVSRRRKRRNFMSSRGTQMTKGHPV
jgi:hypothetical protein